MQLRENDLTFNGIFFKQNLVSISEISELDTQFCLSVKLYIHIQTFWKNSPGFVLLVQKFPQSHMNRHLNPEALKFEEVAMLTLYSSESKWWGRRR